MAMPTIIILDKIPNQDENYILVAPHRTWWGSCLHGLATKPKSSSLWPKKEPFNNRILWLVIRMWRLPIDREKPNASAIKYPINVLKKKSDRSLIMFPGMSLKRCQGWSCPDC